MNCLLDINGNSRNDEDPMKTRNGTAQNKLNEKTTNLYSDVHRNNDNL